MCVFLPCCYFPKRLLELEHTIDGLEDRIRACEKSAQIQGVLMDHVDQRLERLENKEPHDVCVEEIVETIVPQAKPFFSLVTMWFRR